MGRGQQKQPQTKTSKDVKNQPSNPAPTKELSAPDQSTQAGRHAGSASQPPAKAVSQTAPPKAPSPGQAAGQAVKSVAKGFNAAHAAVTAAVVVAGIATGFAAAIMMGSVPNPFIPASVLGVWTFSAKESATPAECVDPTRFDGHNFIVKQDGSKFESEELGDVMKLSGTLQGKNLSFSINIENTDAPGGCGDFSDFNGSISGSTISGTYSGHDCSSYCTWNGSFMAIVTTK